VQEITKLLEKRLHRTLLKCYIAPPKICLFPRGDMDPHLLHNSMGQTRPRHERELDRIRRFCKIHVRYRRTDRKNGNSACTKAATLSKGATRLKTRSRIDTQTIPGLLWTISRPTLVVK